MRYTTQHLCNLFKISHQTVKNYATEFADHLSPTATPGPNRQRYFTDDDLTVIALIVEMKGAGGLYEDIHAALRNGQRGVMPDGSLVSADPGMALVLRQQIDQLTARIRELELDNARKDGQIELLKEMLADAQRRLES